MISSRSSVDAGHVGSALTLAASERRPTNRDVLDLIFEAPSGDMNKTNKLLKETVTRGGKEGLGQLGEEPRRPIQTTGSLTTWQAQGKAGERERMGQPRRRKEKMAYWGADVLVF
jgi:hypothetical protein